MKKLFLQLPTVAVVALGLCGCTSSGSHPTSSASATAESPAAVAKSLADPLSTTPPLGTKVIFQREGTGSQAINLTGLTGSATEVSVSWLCVGGSLQILDGPKEVLGSGCATTPDGALAFGGKVPLDIVKSLTWKLQAGGSTAWRIAITATG